MGGEWREGSVKKARGSNEGIIGEYGFQSCVFSYGAERRIQDWRSNDVVLFMFSDHNEGRS